MRDFGGGGLKRRDFLRLLGLGGAAGAAAALAPGAFGGVAEASEAAASGISHHVPADKGLSPAWLKSLFERGTEAVLRGDELRYVGMPVGGIGAGQLYLCGDGTLGCWEIFNRHVYRGTGERNYAPRTPDKPVEQGFALAVERKGERATRVLCRDGFREVEFTGQYPIGRVAYRDPECPVAVELEAFSPFIPLNADDSALPATMFFIKAVNASSEPVRVSALGWLENAVCIRNAEDVSGVRRTRRIVEPGRALLLHSAEERPAPPPAAETRPAIPLQDFENGYGEWQTAGASFGDEPARGALPWQSTVVGFEGKALANSFLYGDSSTGTLTSPDFRIARRYINFLVGGGDFPFEAMVRLLVDGEVVRSATGSNDERLRWETWDVAEFEGRQARIEVVDDRPYPFGHIMADAFEMSDVKRRGPDGPLSEAEDFGTLALALAGPCDAPESAAAPLPELPLPLVGAADESWTFPERRLGALASTPVELAPGAEHGWVFVLAWHFPNVPHGHRYAARFPDAASVARYALDHCDRLAGDTRLWRDTFYRDSTLPHWLLHRVHSTVSTLATGTCTWRANGRFWAYEGVVSCPGTCTHVWNYAQAEAALFPELARSVRELQDFNPDGGGYHPETGLVGFRGDDQYAADGQCGTVLKAYREHRTSADGAFLERNWPKIRKVLEFCLAQDENDDGLLEGRQHNTYDFDFYGANTFVGALYLAALRAGEEMARERGDAAFADRLRAVFERGRAQSVERLWNGEYFIQDVDLEKHPRNQYGPGCLTDQLFGQTWARQLGLGLLYPAEKVSQALASIWKYNWAPDVGPQNAAHPALRSFATPGEPGMFICTWPKSPYLEEGLFYRNEVWTGSEYQAAAGMIWEGMVERGLAVCRGIDERYHPRKRNPYNEVECGDHYARALASWGVFTALCGFEYHGPRGRIAFAPRLDGDEFRAAFTGAEGWGSYARTRLDGAVRHRIEVRWGRLGLDSIALAPPPGAAVTGVRVQGASGPVAAEHAVEGERLVLTLKERLTLQRGEALEISIET